VSRGRVHAARRVLIVDEDLIAAERLAAGLTSRAPAWQVATADSGVAALARLMAQPTDLVLASLRLSGMGGAALLATIATEYPDIVRFARPTAGPVDAQLRAATSAHQFVRASADVSAVAAQMTRAFSLRDALDLPELRAIVGRVAAVPTLPALYTTLMTELQRPYTSTRRIGELVADDAAMAAKMLQMVNSPFVGLQMRVADPVHAVQLLGLDTVRALVLSTQVLETFRKPTRGVIDVDRLWRHAASVSAIAGGLAEQDGAPAEVVQDARTSGLLHDIGKLLLVATLPMVSARIGNRARLEHRPTFEIEHEELGVTHAELGGYLLGLWGLPETIVEVAAWHHRPPAHLDPSAALSFVVAGNILDRSAMPRNERPDRESVFARLNAVLEPLGKSGRAASWMDWTARLAA
jgi:HD-like signal output (HDOD) protein/CheY-like chemotaxis protein